MHVAVGGVTDIKCKNIGPIGCRITIGLRGLRLFIDNPSADLPKPQCDFEGIDFSLLPPRNFVANLMVLPVMGSA